MKRIKVLYNKYTKTMKTLKMLLLLIITIGFVEIKTEYEIHAHYVYFTIRGTVCNITVSERKSFVNKANSTDNYIITKGILSGLKAAESEC